MMLWEVRISALVSDPHVCAPLMSLSGLLMGAVDDEESDERKDMFMVGDVGRGVMSVDGMTEGTAPTMVDDSGSISCFSCIE